VVNPTLRGAQVEPIKFPKKLLVTKYRSDLEHFSMWRLFKEIQGSVIPDYLVWMSFQLQICICNAPTSRIVTYAQ